MVSGTTFSVLLFSAVTRAGIDVESLSFDSVTFLKGFRAVMLAAAALSLANAALSAARRRKGRRPTGRSAGAQPI
jgi:hypothetical protein